MAVLGRRLLVPASVDGPPRKAHCTTTSQTFPLSTPLCAGGLGRLRGPALSFCHPKPWIVGFRRPLAPVTRPRPDFLHVHQSFLILALSDAHGLPSLWTPTHMTDQNLPAHFYPQTTFMPRHPHGVWSSCWPRIQAAVPGARESLASSGSSAAAPP